MFLQNNIGFSAAESGLLLFPFSIISALTGKFLIPPLMKRLNMHGVARVAMLSMTLGAIFLYLCLILDYPIILLICSIALVNGIGIALGFTALTMMSVHHIPEEQHGLASSVATTAFFFGGGLGLSIVAIFLQISPTQNKIGEAPIIVVACYGLGSLAWLSRNFLKSSPVRRQ
jgi:Na+/melibiose symporter-like transporter